jgi:hypothetical protein
MTADERGADLVSQITYHRRELEHLGESHADALGFSQKTQRLVVELIASLQQELSSLAMPVPALVSSPIRDVLMVVERAH